MESDGVASLEQIAIRSVLLQLDMLDHQTLACLPWTIGRKIWAQVRHFRLDSLRIWRLFVRAYPEERNAFRETRKVPLLNSNVHYTFDEIIKQITAPSFEWITHLMLQDPDLSKSDWGNLQKIKNLGVLGIFGPTSTKSNLDDRVVRGWSEAAEENNAFSRMRVILFIGQSWITERSLYYLRVLPALTLCNMTGCDVDLAQVEREGWKHCSGDERSHELDIEWTFSANPHDAMRAYYQRAASPAVHSENAQAKEEPVLSLYKRSTEFPLDLRCTTRWFLRDVPSTVGDKQRKELQKSIEPPKKRRKLRATKGQSLENVLDTFGM
ncbi:CBS domain-containing protein [Macrophomina phaseolina MS6]|uniref:CBS domain-containing protein n=1 Tax=Macrophomina phaseolina (strain MS6) TaxID=1126212 RepID=K2S5Z2_MACPH|nr:CBS domain-containing protein [Macrophomina phaseolina MS6]